MHKHCIINTRVYNRMLSILSMENKVIHNRTDAYAFYCKHIRLQ